MCTNPTFQPSLSPHTVLQIIDSPLDVGFTLVTNIAKGLAAMIDQCDQVHLAEEE